MAKFTFEWPSIPEITFGCTPARRSEVVKLCLKKARAQALSRQAVRAASKHSLE